MGATASGCDRARGRWQTMHYARASLGLCNGLLHFGRGTGPHFIARVPTAMAEVLAMLLAEVCLAMPSERTLLEDSFGSAALPNRSHALGIAGRHRGVKKILPPPKVYPTLPF